MLTHGNLLANMRQCRIFMEKASGTTVKNGSGVSPLPCITFMPLYLHGFCWRNQVVFALIPNPRDLDITVIAAWQKFPLFIFCGYNIAVCGFGESRRFKNWIFLH